MKMKSFLLLCVSILLHVNGFAEDWPQWRGKDRLGIWTETGIVEQFPKDGLKVDWRAPIGGGYSGPAVSEGRVFITDFHLDPETKRIDGKERTLAIDEKTGKEIWTLEWPVDYAALMQSYATGPRATPTVDGERVYVMGAVGHIYCSNAKTGEVIWSHDTVKESNAHIPMWGTSSPPLVDGNLAIFMVGADPDGKVIAYDKKTGKEVWRALASNSEIGYSAPIMIEAAGKRQLIVWHIKGVDSLDPQTGKIYWEDPYVTPQNMAISTPVKSGSNLFISNFYGGSLMMELDEKQPGEKQVWQIKGKNERPPNTESIHTVITTPVIENGYIYSTDSYGETRCLKAATGERVWEDKTMCRQGRWGSAFIVKNGDRWFVNNDIGDLMIIKFNPEKYTELDRTKLIKPTTNSGFGPRRLFESTVNWVHPAYANKHIVTRNDEEIIRASLEK